MISLTDEERAAVESFIRGGKANARNITRAHILLKSAEGWSIERIAETYSVSQATVSNWRQRYRMGGVERVLKDKVQQNRRCALAGAEEAVLVAIACSPVPDGHDHWTVRMLQTKLVELGVVEGSLSASTIPDRLKEPSIGGYSIRPDEKRQELWDKDKSSSEWRVYSKSKTRQLKGVQGEARPPGTRPKTGGLFPTDLTMGGQPCLEPAQTRSARAWDAVGIQRSR